MIGSAIRDRSIIKLNDATVSSFFLWSTPVDLEINWQETISEFFKKHDLDPKVKKSLVVEIIRGILLLRKVHEGKMEKDLFVE